MRKEKSMSSINYEEDQRKDLDSVNESDKLSDQVVKLTNLEDELAQKEKELKELKRKVELVSGGNHSYNDAGNEHLHIKTRRRNFS